MSGGFGIFSEGQAANWFRQGHTSVKVQTNLDITYGVSTFVTVGITNRYSLGAVTGITAGSKFDAMLGAEYLFKKTKSFTNVENGSFYAMNSYAGSVGASDKKLSHATGLKWATYLLLALQTAAMTATTSIATVQASAAAGKQAKNKDQQEGAPADDTLSTQEERVNVILWLMSNITTTVSALTPLFMVIADKWTKLNKTDSPTAVLTMDATGGIFLGTRRRLDPNPSSGVFINETGVTLSSARQDTEYNKPENSTSILGFTEDASDPAMGGSKVQVAADGVTRIGGKGIKADLVTLVGPSFHHINAESHSLNVTQPRLHDAAGPALNLKADLAQLKADDDSSVSIRPGTISALAGGANGSVMRLTPKSSAIGTGGNHLIINSSGVLLRFGDTKLRIDSTGFALGDVLTVLKPGAPGVTFADLKDAASDAAAVRAQLKAEEMEKKKEEKIAKARENATNVRNTTLVATKAALNEATDAL